jgi:hypothetical protein
VTRMTSEGEDYLQRFPHLAARWMNQCVICHQRGYKLDLPEINSHDWLVETAFADTLRTYFKPLSVDEEGRCDQCRGSRTP